MSYEDGMSRSTPCFPIKLQWMANLLTNRQGRPTPEGMQPPERCWCYSNTSRRC